MYAFLVAFKPIIFYQIGIYSLNNSQAWSCIPTFICIHVYVYMHIATQVYVFLVTKHCSSNLISSMPAPYQAKGLCTWGVTVVITRGKSLKKPDYQVSYSFMSQDSQKRRDDFKKGIILSLALWISCNYSWDIVIEWPLLTPGGLYFQVLYPNWSGQSSVIHSHWPHHFTCMEVTWPGCSCNKHEAATVTPCGRDGWNSFPFSSM